MKTKSKTDGIINWAASREEMLLIAKIAKRAVELAKKHGVNYEPITADMDITATHLNGCPLNLEALLNADEFNFAHDVFGIRRHIDRETGELTGCFVPRFAKK